MIKRRDILRRDSCTGSLPKKERFYPRISMPASFYVFFYDDDHDALASYVMSRKRMPCKYDRYM